jgi:parallel beta-helix repeat protein
VTVTSNLVQGNQAGAGDGGGIRTEFVNGLDVRRARDNPAGWYQLTLTNNKVVNNIAAMAGGGISLQDTVKAVIDNNTVANNDSTATAGAAFPPGSPNRSTPQPAGIVSRAHTKLLFNTIGAASGYKLPYSNPVLTDNVMWHNRSFYWTIDRTVVPASFGLIPDIGVGQPAVYSDLGVLGTAQQGTWPGYVDAGADKLNPMNSIVTSTAGYDVSNNSSAPGFLAEYFNGERGQAIIQPGLLSSIITAAAMDEGGNWLDVRFGPLTLYQPCLTPGSCLLYGDYRLSIFGGIGANP